MARKEVQIPPCSCCGDRQKQYESWYQITPERVFYDNTVHPLNFVTGSPNTFFLCPSCFKNAFKELIPYEQKIETCWVPQQ